MKYLDEWFKDARIEIDDFFPWLQKQSPEEWHLATVTTTHDGDHEKLFWVINQPECELSTALNIFWAGNPEETLTYTYARSISPERNNGELYRPLDGSFKRLQILFQILKNVKIGFYTRRNIAFPPKELPGFDERDLAARLKNYLLAEEQIREANINVPWNFSVKTAIPISGRKADSQYDIDQGCVVYMRYDLWCQKTGKSGNIWASPYLPE